MTHYKWLIEVLFSGLGTEIIRTISFKKRKQHNLLQKQKSGKNSINYQAGHNVEIKKTGNSNE